MQRGSRSVGGLSEVGEGQVAEHVTYSTSAVTTVVRCCLCLAIFRKAGRANRCSVTRQDTGLPAA